MVTNAGRCPKCGFVVYQVKTEPISVVTGPFGTGESYKAVSYLCLACDAVLSVSIDPLALEADIIKQVARVIRRKS
jgi:hypothetical protein